MPIGPRPGAVPPPPEFAAPVSFGVRKLRHRVWSVAALPSTRGQRSRRRRSTRCSRRAIEMSKAGILKARETTTSLPLKKNEPAGPAYLGLGCLTFHFCIQIHPRPLWTLSSAAAQYFAVFKKDQYPPHTGPKRRFHRDAIPYSV